MAATAHGIAPASPRSPTGRGARSPTGVPQRWQNFAPGESAAWQLAQLVPPSAAPHSAQNRPVALAPQEGQVVVGGVLLMRGR
jgi:hypothetical protein